MGAHSIQNVRLAGIAAAVPALREIDWETLGAPAESFRRARSRRAQPVTRAAPAELCQSDLCQHAAEKLLTDLGWQASEIDLIVLVTLTPDYPIPATAIILQGRLGVPKTALAFDLPGSDATFLQGIALVASMLSAGDLRRGLLLCGEVSKGVEGPESIDSFEQLCGHNGGVLAFEHSPGVEPIHFANGGDGSAFRDYFMEVGGTRCPPQPEMFSPERAAVFDNPASHFTQNISGISAAARRELPPLMRTVLAGAGKTMGEVDYCFVQPMGMAAEEAVRTDLGIRRDRFHTAPSEYGRGGSGSAVLAMLARAASRLERESCNVLLGGIGAGLAWGSVFLSTDRVVCPEIVEVA